MRFLGIDYGAKRIGLAVSDEEGRLAFPKKILENSRNIFAELGAIISAEKIKEIVIGDSVDFKGQPNKIASEIEIFIAKLEKEFGLPVYKQQEFLTSVEARRYEDSSRADAKAAALVLQRYLDKFNKQK